MFEKIKCEDCGASSFSKVDDQTIKCNYCGAKLQKKQLEKQGASISQIAASVRDDIKNNKSHFAIFKLIVCILFGAFGVHRFIEGKIVSGLVFLFTYGVFGIGYILDIFRLVREVSEARRQQ